MYLACPVSAILDDDEDEDEDTDSDESSSRKPKRKSAKNIDWPTFEDEEDFDERAGSKLKHLFEIIHYHLADDTRRPAKPSPIVKGEMVFPDATKRKPTTQKPKKKIMVFYNFTCMTSTMESVSVLIIPFRN